MSASTDIETGRGYFRESVQKEENRGNFQAFVER